MIYKGTFTELILKLLLYKTHSFKQVEEIVRKHRQYKDVSGASIRSTLSRLKSKGLVSNKSNSWSITKLASSIIENRPEFNEIKPRINKNNSGDEMIIMYDVPESLKTKRDRMREALEIIGFKQKQKSVWIGPVPLPEKFIDFLNELGLIEYINFFRVKKEDVI